MKESIEKIKNLMRGSKWLIISDGVMLIIAIAVVVVFSLQFTSITLLKKDISTTKENLSKRIALLEAGLATSTLTSQQLADRLEAQQSDFQDTISDISSTVGTLEKLSKTDKELLQKYSRVYFLNDNYVPLNLSEIDSDYVNDSKKTLEFHSSALSYLEKMLSAAKSKDIDLKVVSAYRSFGTQSALKASYLTTYGSGSNQFSADQGYSEHQLGTAVDLTVAGQDVDLSISFEKTTAFDWLSKNAYKYGFILSYPKGNAYYQYEPWHWRFVGKSLATKLHRDGINFSDMDQREIDTYLVKIFD